MSKDEAFRVQKDYYKRYGTTMRGLMTEHGLNPDDYLEYVHQIDHSPLEPNPALGAALEKLPGRKLILTNGTRKHADAVMRRLEIDQHFEDVFDIVAAELEPKPLPQVYERFLERHDVDPTKAAMFEDLARNLEVPHALGMTTVLVVPDRPARSVPRGLGTEGRDDPHVDHVTDDLTGFLGSACDHAPGMICCMRTASPMPAMPAPTSRSGDRSADFFAINCATLMAASATALWMTARPSR